jgi:hypothetical protein
VGLNPYRSRTKRTSDIALVAVALTVVFVLVLWALLG